MLTLGPLLFANPWLLLGLGLLPGLYWLIRITPPSARRIPFPAIRLLMQLPRVKEAPAHTPWWLLLLRVLLAALVIVALARPVLDPAAPLAGAGPLVIALDDGWTAAPSWEATRAEALGLVEQAERDGRSVAIATSAAASGPGAPAPAQLLRGPDARALIQALEPKPWAGERARMAAALAGLAAGGADVHWLSDGLGEGASDKDFAARLVGLGSVTLNVPNTTLVAMALQPPRTEPGAMIVLVARADTSLAEDVEVIASQQGRALASATVHFDAGAARAEARVELPPEIRNGIDRVSLSGQTSAGGVFLMDERWRRRPVGLVSGDAAEAAQPLLSDIYYLNRALAPFSDVRVGKISDLLARPLALMAVADIGQIVGPDREALMRWLDEGGVLVRFAGPRLAAQSDDLVPVPLREGDRALGGALTWEQPQPLADFPEGSPFTGLTVPPEVTVGRQVLAEPTPGLAARTWARLRDGTPLVTAERRGKGWLVLVHTSANAEWSNFALSGLYVDVLRRLVELSAGISAGDGDVPLPPWSLLDGWGRLGNPGPTALPLQPASLGSLQPGPEHPPGFYGDATARRALNIGRADTRLAPLGPIDGVRRQSGSEAKGERDLMPLLLAAALGLVLLDTLLGLFLRGLVGRERDVVVPALVLATALSLGLLLPSTSHAQTRDSLTRDTLTRDTGPTSAEAGSAAVLDAVLGIHLAYVVTGDGLVDETSRAGLNGLGGILRTRTAVDARAPLGVDPERDDLSLYPLIYWPMTASQKPLSAEALARIDGYMKAGGTILFDTRDAESSFDQTGGGGGTGTRILRALLGQLDLPPLVPVPAEHVLTRSFYLLKSFPGRSAGGTVWVEAAAAGANDGVSSIVIGGNDWAAAWAADDGGRPLAPLEGDDPKQREYAYRFGVNLVMYALTGNYKADQVHVPALLERLGQ